MTRDAPYLYLTTVGRITGRLREIEIWFTQRDARYYLLAEHGERSHWVQNIRANPRVRVRVGMRSFEARGRVVTPEADPALVRAVRRMSEKKYGWGDGLLIELVRARRGRPPLRSRGRGRTPRRGAPGSGTGSRRPALQRGRVKRRARLRRRGPGPPGPERG